MNSGEILQLQFGHYSNFIGTHFWNIQEATFDYEKPSEEINHDCLFREGQRNKGQVTFTPRCLLVDLKGSLKSLPEYGTLYDHSDDNRLDICWDGATTEIKQDDESKNQLQMDLDNSEQIQEKKYNLESDVKVWSDYLYTRFHHRTINIIKDYEHESQNSQFDVFPLGSNLWKTMQFQDDFSDKIRKYIEEADSFQGFQIILDAENAFGGLASSCIEYIRDEYERKSVLSFPVIPPYYSDYAYENNEERYQSLLKDSLRIINIMLCFESLGSLSSLFVPLCTSASGWRQPGPKREFHHLSYDHTLPYHSSAILASAIDTLTLKQRLKGTHYSLSDLCADLNTRGRTAAAASICLPFSINNNADLIECLDMWDGPLTQSITPNCTIGTDKIMQLFTLRGISEKRLKRPKQQAGKQNAMEAYKCNSIQEMLSFYLSCNYFLCHNNVTSIKEPLPVKLPYPQLFDKRVGVNGNIITVDRPQDIAVQSVPVLAGIHSVDSIGDMLESLHSETKRMKFARFHQFTSTGLEEDEFKGSLEGLLNLRECYRETDYI